MSALANQPFVKMNGIGNEIIVVDLRKAAAKITADEARAAVKEWLESGDYDRAVADIVAHDPDLWMP